MQRCLEIGLKSGTKRQWSTKAGYILNQFPSNWATFLRVDLNKQELFVELAKNLKDITLLQGKHLFTTLLGDCACSLPDADVGAVAPCTQEEADTRLFLHVAATTVAGNCRVIVRTSDSNVAVLGISSFVALVQQIDELWIAFGMRHPYR